VSDLQSRDHNLLSQDDLTEDVRGLEVDFINMSYLLVTAIPVYGESRRLSSP